MLRSSIGRKASVAFLAASGALALAVPAHAESVTTPPALGGEQVPVSDGQVPVSDGQVPAGDGQVPAGDGQVPAGDGQVPAGDGQVPAGDAQAGPGALDSWIQQALGIMAAHNIPGSYDGIKRNIMRESSGNPRAINNWDVNAQNGTPSKGLLQVIDPTFNTYHVDGTANDPFDPVANIVAACNYAANRYGSIDNVNGAY
ncbi:transglycosylase SLT domain-containing protein [Streptomyces vinaceus]